MTSDPLQTGDGSYTLRHPELGELYHARDGADSEARNKFIRPSRLSERLARGPVTLLDIGFGLGVNVLETLTLSAPHGLQVFTLERDREVLEQAAPLRPHPLFEALIQTGRWENGHQSVDWLAGDLRTVLPSLDLEVDVIFHDPFQPLCNTEAWTVEVFQHLFRLLKPEGCLVTYSQSRIVRAGLCEAGFSLGETPAIAPQRGGTEAVKPPHTPASPLHTPEEGWGPPFRDPDLSDSPQAIRSRREAEHRHLHQD